ncbi:MAG TPA: hypothetical protein VG943_13025 [Caulobacterales bacterium]|nr:hypothetical protein [Caulobacterales bacterium]
MKTRLFGAAMLALALASTSAYAETAQFRSVAPQTFSAQDLQSYGLDAATAQRAEQLQAQGYQVKVLTPEEAQRYQAGISDNQWLLLGILAGVIVIAVAVSD